MTSPSTALRKDEQLGDAAVRAFGDLVGPLPLDAVDHPQYILSYSESGTCHLFYYATEPLHRHADTIRCMLSRRVPRDDLPHAVLLPWSDIDSHRLPNVDVSTLDALRYFKSCQWGTGRDVAASMKTHAIPLRPQATSSSQQSRPPSRPPPALAPAPPSARCLSQPAGRIGNAARVAAVQQFVSNGKRPDGSVAFDEAALLRLMESSRARALARGSSSVTPRDVRDAASLLTVAPRSARPSSPADAVPEHEAQLQAALAAVHEDVQQAKSGGVPPPRVLVAGETSGVVAHAFLSAGADVATCDLEVTTTPEIPHFQGDSSHIQDLGWHLVVAHPPCTYLSNAGVQYLHTEPGRRARLEEAVNVFKQMRAAAAPFVAVEHPKIHRYARELLDGLRPTQYIHPWQHGTGHTKPTALYLTDLPPLRPTCEVAGRTHALADLPPGPERSARRSRTYRGIAAAMAIQWTPILLEHVRSAPASPRPITAVSLVAAATRAMDPDSILTVGVATHRPWELSRPIRDATLFAPVRRLRRLRGRWYALARQEDTEVYSWAPTVDEDNSALEVIAARYNPSDCTLTADQRGDQWRVGSPKDPDTAVDSSDQQELTDITSRWQCPAVAAAALQLPPSSFPMYLRDRRACAERDARWQASAQLLAQALRPHGVQTTGPSARRPGLHTDEDGDPQIRPPLSTVEQLRADYSLSFVSRGTQHLPASRAVASVATPTSPTPHPLMKPNFTSTDIAEPPPPLPYTPRCAYIRDFVVSRLASVDATSVQHFRVDAAACRIVPSLSDTGAGPSCVGSAILAQLPKDAAVARTHRTRTDETLVGADGKPLLTRGTVDIVFTMGGHAFRHPFTVVEGGDLLLLGNDFIALYGASVTPLDKDGEGCLEMTITRDGTRRPVSVPLSCQSVHPTDTARAAAVIDPANASAPPDTVDAGETLPPALVPIGTPPAAPNAPASVAGPTADDRYSSEFRTEDYLLYCEQPITIPARTETTVWLRVPLAMRKFETEVLVDRLPERLGLTPAAMTACALARISADGLVPVTLLNINRRQVTVPAASPVARLEVGYEVSQAGALDPTASDPYERLSEAERSLVDSVKLDPDNRLSTDQLRRVRSLLARHHRVFAMNPKSPSHTHLMEVELPLKSDAVPHRHSASRLGEAGSTIVDEHCAEMEANGIIRKSNSAWGSRVVLVKKKGGETRFCIDFRDLNAKLRTCDSPIPRCDEAIDQLASGAGPQDSLFLCTLDLASGFWTLPIAEKDKGLTAFVTRRQKYEFNYLPFGVQSGPSYMCRLMDAALQGLAWEICMPYLDDVGIWSTGVGADFDAREEASFEQMMTRLDLVLERLTWAGLSAKATKCVLFATAAEYLGHVISRRGLEMDPAKISKIKAIDPTEINSIEKVRAFVGLCSYYRRFVPGFAKVTAPLTDLTKDGVDVAVESQRPAAQAAIVSLIDIMTTEPVILRMPRFDRPFIVKTDGAQTEGIGGLLVQMDDEDHERVVAYYGRRLTKAERNYTVTEIELLAALECIRNWRPYLWGRRFKLVIDHAALKWLHTMKETIEGGPASRLTRWNLKLLEYDFEVEHKPGKNHSDADAVSRLVAVIASARRNVTTGRSLQAEERQARTAADSRAKVIESYVNTDTPCAVDMHEAQMEDDECNALRAALDSGDDVITRPTGSESLRLVRWARREARHLRFIGTLLYRVDPVFPPAGEGVPPTPSPLFGDRTPPTPSPRLFIPRDLREAYLHAFHVHLGHPGQSRMFATMRRRVYWPGMVNDIRKHVEACHDCNVAKRLTRRLAHPRRAEFGAYPFDIVVCDICSMVKSEDGLYDKILVFADSLSRWVEAIPFSGDPDAEQVLDAFATHVACRYGWPRIIRSDGGSNLASLLTGKIFELTGVDRSQGSKYHPESQGIAERVQGTLIEMCRAANEGGSRWPDHLPFLLFSYHATPHRITGLSPAMLLYGRELRLPSQLDDFTGGTPDVADSSAPAAALPAAVRSYASTLHRRLVAAWHTASSAVANEQERQAADAYIVSDVSKTFAPGDRVCYRHPDRANKLHSQWFGPVRVLENLGNGNYRLRDLPNNILSDRFHIRQLRPYRASVDAEELADDEYLVDRLLDSRLRNGAKEYKVKWRQCPVSESSWVSRTELLRRCADLVHAYDAADAPLVAPPAPSQTPPNDAVSPTLPRAEPPTRLISSLPDRTSDDLPFSARLARGSWTYGRRIATPRGHSVRWFPAASFTPSALESEHFRKLRRDAAFAAPAPVAAVVHTVSANSHRLDVVAAQCFHSQ